MTSSKDDNWNESKNTTKLHQIITLLFQACANSPSQEYSIRKCDSIRFYLRNRNITPNVKNYSALISAYGKAGAIYESFNVVDEMIQNNIHPDLSVFNNLLCACISQPNYGFRYALMVWQMCLKFKIKPNLNMYQLLLRAANDCSISFKKEKIYVKSFIQTDKTELINEKKNLFPKNTDEYKTFIAEDFQNTLNSQKENISNFTSIKDVVKKFNSQSLLNYSTEHVLELKK